MFTFIINAAPDESHFCVLNDNNDRVVEYSRFQRLPNPAWAHDINNFPLNGGVSVAHAPGQAQVQPPAVAHPPTGAPGRRLDNPAPVHPPTSPAIVHPPTVAPLQPQPTNPIAAHPPVGPAAANLVAPATGPAQAPSATPVKFRVIASSIRADPTPATATTGPTRSSGNTSTQHGTSVANQSAATPPASPGRNPNNPIIVLDSPVRTISRRVHRNGTLEYCTGTRMWMMPHGTLPCCVHILYLEDHPNHSPANLMSAKLVQHTDTSVPDDRAPGTSASKGTGPQKRAHGAMDQPTASGSGASSKKRRT